MPHVHIVGMEHQYDAQTRHGLYKAAYGAHNHRLAAQQHKLLGHIRSHAQSAPSGYQDKEIAHSFIT